MAINPAGFQVVMDWGNPRTFTGRARSAISGGGWVFCSGAGDEVGSALASFVAGDVLVAADASGTQVNGVALFNVASGTTNKASVLTQGWVITPAYAAILAGEKVGGVEGATNAVGSLAVAASPSLAVGRAITGATSGGFFIVDVCL